MAGSAQGTAGTPEGTAFAIVSLDARPELTLPALELLAVGWPEFMQHDPVAERHQARLVTTRWTGGSFGPHAVALRGGSGSGPVSSHGAVVWDGSGPIRSPGTVAQGCFWQAVRRRRDVFDGRGWR
jgi:hypothetical protein